MIFINDITHVFATHLYRTSLTVLPIAELAEVRVKTFPKDAEYSVDVVKSVCPTLEALRSTPTNSTITDNPKLQYLRVKASVGSTVRDPKQGIGG